MASKSSGIVGVKNENNKWVASIKTERKSIILGRFDNIEDAIKARKNAEIKYFGEFRFDMSNKDVISEENIHEHLIKQCV